MNKKLILTMILLIAQGYALPMEFTIESVVAKDIFDSHDQKTIRFGAFVKTPQSKQICYAWSEKTMPIPYSATKAHLLLRAKVFSHNHGWRDLNFYETETLFTKFSAMYYNQSVDAERKQEEQELTTQSY